MLSISNSNQSCIPSVLDEEKNLTTNLHVVSVKSLKLIILGLSQIVCYCSYFRSNYIFTLLGLIAFTCLFEITTLTSVKAQDPSVWIYQYSRGVTSGPTTFSEAPSKGKIFFYIWTSSGSTNAMVNYSVTQVGDFLTDSTITSSNQTKQVTGSVEELEFAITDDNIDEPDGSITVTLLAGTGYILSQTQSHPKSITITITDNDAPPVINLEAPASPVVAGNNARFTLTTSMNSKWSEAFDVQIAVTERVGNFVEDNSWPTTVNFGTNLTDNAITKNYDFTTIVADDNDIFTSSESTGSVEVTISPDTNGRENYTIGTGVLTRYIVSEDIPIAAISAPSASVSEGETVSLLISVTGKWESEIAVEVELEDGSRGLIGSPAPNTAIRFSANPAGTPQTKSFSMPISSNDIFSTTNQITISIKTPTRSSSYQVIDDSQSTGTTNRSSVTITVAELSNPPKIEIIVPTIPIQSGNLASIPIKATGKWTDPFTIPVTISNQVGDYFTGLSYPPNVVFTKNTSEISVTKFYNFQLALGGFGNTFGTYEGTEIDGSFSIELTEDTTNTPKRYELMTQSKQLIVVNRDKPVISVSIPDEMVNEGDTANFSITAIGFWTNEFSVQVNFDDNNTNTIGSAPPMTVTFDANTTEFTVSKMYPVNTLDDDIDEMNGEVTVTIELPDNAAYTISNLYSHTESKTILDNGPLITIETVNSYVTRGQLAQIRVNANSNLIDDTTIQVNVSQSNCISGTPDEEVIIKQGESNGLLEILTTEGSNDCEIAATLESGEHYKIGTSNTVATIMTGNEVIYTVSISTGTPIFEGTDAEFTISTTPIPQQTFTLNYEVSQIGNFILWRVKNSINLNTQTSDTTLTIKTHNDEVRETNGSISVKLLDGTGFQLGARDSDTLVVMDNDQNVPSTPQSRISIARSAVNSILSYLDSRTSQENSIPNEYQLASGEIEENRKHQNVVVSIYPKSRNIQEGEIAEFRLQTSRQSSTEISINLNLETNEKVIKPRNKVVNFPANQTETSFFVETTNDEDAGPDSVLSISITKGQGYILGANSSTSVTISDSADREQARLSRIDSVHQSVLSEFLDRTSTETHGLISTRMEFLASGRSPTYFKFGNNDISEFMKTGNELFFENQSFRSSALGEAAFSFNLFPEYGVESRVGLWGKGNFQDIQQNSGEATAFWRGNMYSATTGTDYKINQEFITGFAYSYADSQIDFNSVEGDLIQHQSEFHGLSPYLGWNSSTHDAQLHLISSIKQGKSLIEHKSYESVSYNNTLYYLGLGGHKNLWSLRSESFNNPINLDLNGNAWFAQLYSESVGKNLPQTQIESGYLNVAIQGSHLLNVTDYINVKPKLSLGFQSRQKTQQSDYGIVLGSSFELDNSAGMVFTGSGQILQDQNIYENYWGISTKLDYDSNNDNLGILLQINQSMGQFQEDVNVTTLNNKELFSNVGEYNQSNQYRIGSELGFGFSVLDHNGSLTPFGGFKHSSDYEQEFTTGLRLNLYENIKFELAGNRISKSNNEYENHLKINGGLSW